MNELRRYRATRFIKPMDRGINRPFLVLATEVDGTEPERFVVKPTAGYQDHTEGPAIDCLATLLARAFGLLSPEPVLVELTTPPSSDKASAGTTQQWYLGDAWLPWMAGAVPKTVRDEADGVYAFDGLVQNTDRPIDNPNLLWKGKHLAVLDHEKAFGHVRKNRGTDQPWRPFLSSGALLQHCLRELAFQLQGVRKDDFAKELWEAILQAQAGGTIRNAFEILENAAPDFATALTAEVRRGSADG